MRLSTHIPTEPAVTGGEHTAVGCSAAGLLLWLSPWQVRQFPALLLSLDVVQRGVLDSTTECLRLAAVNQIQPPEPSAAATGAAATAAASCAALQTATAALAAVN